MENAADDIQQVLGKKMAKADNINTVKSPKVVLVK